MVIIGAVVVLRAEWVHSLKEKRMLIKSILAKTRNRYNVSASEVGRQDEHEWLVIGLAIQSANGMEARRMIEKIIDYVEDSSDAVLYETTISDMIQLDA